LSAAIVIRWSPSENTLRSTGEPPGVIVLAFPDGHPTFAIDRGWEPHTAPPGTTTADWFEEGISPLAEPVSIEDAVEACFGREEVKHLYQLGAQTFHMAIQVMLGAQAFDAMRELVAFMEDLADAVNERLAP
jgi:hypothetical protein